VPYLGGPDEVYLGDPPADGQVAFVYRSRPSFPEVNATGVGLVLTELRGDISSGAVSPGKGHGPGTRLQLLAVNGGQGYWIEGDLHVYFFPDANGEIEPETVRLARNALLWQQCKLTLRIESALGKDAVLRIAQSVR
jgi:hypothetical protein